MQIGRMIGENIYVDLSIHSSQSETKRRRSIVKEISEPIWVNSIVATSFCRHHFPNAEVAEESSLS